MSSVASVPAPVGAAHRAQGETGAGLPIQALGSSELLILGQSKSAKASL